jgi:hypothetical protein
LEGNFFGANAAVDRPLSHLAGKRHNLCASHLYCGQAIDDAQDARWFDGFHTDDMGHSDIARVGKDLMRRTTLADAAFIQHEDKISERQCLDAVMRDDKYRRAKAHQQSAEFPA